MNLLLYTGVLELSRLFPSVLKITATTLISAVFHILGGIRTFTLIETLAILPFIIIDLRLAA